MPVNFITDDPVSNGQRQQQQFEQGNAQLEATRLQIEEARRTADAERNVDKAVREYIKATAAPAASQPSPLSEISAAAGPSGVVPTQVAPAAGPQRAAGPAPGLPHHLASVPGGGATALRIITADRDREARAADAKAKRDHQDRRDRAGRQHKERTELISRMFDAMKTGDIAAGQALSSKLGFNWPQEVWTNSQMRAKLAEAGTWQKFYGDDVEAFGRFFSSALQNADPIKGPDYEAAYHGSPPRNVEQNRGSRPADVQTAEWLMKNLRLNPQDAYTLATQARQNPLQGASRVYSLLYKSYSEQGDTPQQAAQKATEAAQQFVANFGNTVSAPQPPQVAKKIVIGGHPFETKADASGAAHPVVRTREEYDKLSKGQKYWHPNGSLREK